MMEVELRGVAKRFGNERVFQAVTRVFAPGSRTAVLGANGSGKSTLLQVVAGALVPTAGSVVHRMHGQVVDPERVYRQLSIASPFLSLYEDLSLRESIGLHADLKPLLPGVDLHTVASTAYLEQHLEKPVRDLSSGMRQRLKLALAILSNSPLLLLDEPTANLDAKGSAWFAELLTAHLGQRTLLVASNRQQEETFACTAVLHMEDLK